ncbi:hypothetical protein HDZ31DRAFT_75449 [Schizophyllum fasciatum]
MSLSSLLRCTNGALACCLFSRTTRACAPGRRGYATPASQETTNIEHSQFLSEAPPDASWKKRSPSDEPGEEEAALEDAAGGQGKLLPTASHLFKLILPLSDAPAPPPTPSESTSKPPPDATPSDSSSARAPAPVVFLLHPSQPLSHVGRLIASEVVPLMEKEVDASGAQSPAPSNAYRPPPRVAFHSTSPSGKVSHWADSTDVADFMREAARVAKFSVVIVDPESKQERAIDVQVPSFASRTRYLRRRLAVIESQLKGMDKVKRECDHLARRGARRMALGGFAMLVVYWGAVARLTFWDYGWDIMEPITYLSGLSTVICGYLWFLYQGREVSYTSVLDHSISSRREALYRSRGLDIERYADLVAEAKNLRREISKIAEDYDRDKWDDVVEDERGRPIRKEDLEDPSTQPKSESRRKVDEVTGAEDRKERGA